MQVEISNGSTSSLNTSNEAAVNDKLVRGNEHWQQPIITNYERRTINNVLCISAFPKNSFCVVVITNNDMTIVNQNNEEFTFDGKNIVLCALK